MKKYILDGHKAVEEPDILKWAAWFEGANKIVKKDTATVTVGGEKAGEIRISTVFLGIDHSFNGGEPILFETMVFGGKLDQEMDRCSTWEAAEKMHELMCEKVKLSGAQH
jgi:hypothetical protein